MTQRNISCWVVSEGLAGTENQCLGIADALGVSPTVKRIKLRFPWKQLSPYLRCGHQWAFDSAGDSLAPPWPDLVLASGRKSIAAALHIKRQSNGKTLVVQVQDPRIPARLFDLVTVPQHDPTRGDNVIITTGALHRVTVAKLAEEAAKFPLLQELPARRAAVMIGGNSKAHRLTEENAAALAARLQELAEDYSLMITVSRRTPPACLDILQKTLADNPRVYFWDGSGANPYFAFLECADILLVTEDSVSMTSEAISTGKPVYTIPMEGGAARVNKFHHLLQTQGYTRILPQEGTLESWHYTPPQDTAAIAAKIQALLEERVNT
ncbi:MAG: hypothetical protein HND56_06545 [Pseudomonadota bacterium]|nr:hypothetical protein [Pseudomonadota bacterium]QKK05363.1 MAG: hypothetical protein HND56_06545 [Pseudomonadota bacterium]